MQDRVYQTEIHDVDELKQRLIAILADMNQSVINKAVAEWHSRLEATFWTVAMLNMSTTSSFACLTVYLRNFAEITKTLCVPQIAISCYAR